MVSEVLDAASAPFASLIGASAAEVSESFGNHALAGLLEVPAQFIFPTLGQVLVYAGAGIGLLIARKTVPALSGGRPGMDAMDLSSHLLQRVLVMAANPVTAQALAADVALIRAGNWQAALIRNPTEIQRLVNDLIAAFQQIIGTPAGGAAFRPAVGPTAMVGGRSVTGITVLPSQAGGAEGVIF